MNKNIMLDNYEEYNDIDYKECSKKYKRIKFFKTVAVYLAITSAFSALAYKKNKDYIKIENALNNTEQTFTHDKSFIDDYLSQNENVVEGIYQDENNYYDVKYCPYVFDGNNYYFNPTNGYYVYNFYMIKKINYESIPSGTEIIKIEKPNKLKKVL